MTHYKDIFTFIEEKENEYARPIDVRGWSWGMKEHIQTSFFYKHGRLTTGNDPDKPVKNIVRPLLNLQYRAEDLDVKDILIYVDDPDNYHLSFLVKKYHDDVFVQKYNLDEFLDDIKEAKIDYGAGITKRMNSPVPVNVPLESIAFCDQTNILGGPIAFLHNLSVDELKEREQDGWGDIINHGATVTIDELVKLADDQKTQSQEENTPNETPGKYIEVYEVHGMLPKSFLDDSEYDGTFVYQLQIVAFYKTSKGERNGVILFRKKQKKGNLKVILRDKIYDRATGFGAVEELFEPQVWTNYSEIRKKEMLDATSKILLKTTDSTFRAKHPTGLKDLDNLEVLELQDGNDIGPLDTTPRSMALFENSVREWYEYAQGISGATDALLGKKPTAGTPFKLQDLLVQEGQGLHDYRRGKFAKFVEEIYRDWIIPHIEKEITNGTRFLSQLTTDELDYVADALAKNKAKKYFTEKVLNGERIEVGEIARTYNETKQDFIRGGNKKFIEILEGEFKKQPIRVKINVAGKQKNLARMTDNLVNIFRQVISSPEGFQRMMNIPDMARNFNQILEFSGLTPVNYSGFVRGPLETREKVGVGEGQGARPVLEPTETGQDEL